jgi:hypothetical protein
MAPEMMGHVCRTRKSSKYSKTADSTVDAARHGCIDGFDDALVSAPR